MTTRKDDGRKLIQLTAQPEFYERVRQHCRSLDIPITVWARELMKRELDATHEDL